MSSIAPVGPTTIKSEDTAPAKPVQSPPAPAPSKVKDSVSISPEAKQLLDRDGDTDKAGAPDTDGAKKTAGVQPPTRVPHAAPPASTNVDATTQKVAALRKQGMSVADIAQRIGKSEAQVKAMIAATQH